MQYISKLRSPVLLVSYLAGSILVVVCLVGCGGTAATTKAPTKVLEDTDTPAPTHTASATHTPPPTSIPTATSTSSPTAKSTITATPTPSVIYMQADGSGDYANLEEAVESVPAGATIVLSKGIFHMEKTLYIRKSLHLVGEGIDETEIVSKESGGVVRVVDQASITAQGITFRYQGSAGSGVVIVSNAEVEFTHCRFTGGKYGEGVSGHGLALMRGSSGYVRNSIADENSVGIVMEASKVTLEENVCDNNEEFGIVFIGNSAGTARKNKCSGNQWSGILAAERAKPTLEENTLTENGENGILFAANSAGTARLNECSDNGFSGITIMGGAQPIIEENACNTNGRDGISFFDASGGEAVGNECSNNTSNGIGVYDQAQPMLESNVCTDNDGDGIAFLDDSGGIARQNECSGNFMCVSVEWGASPELADNICYDNIFEDFYVESITPTPEITATP